jgi:hypothetical protein
MASTKVKVPKKVGGLKVPKSLRKSGAVNMFLNHDLGRLILADVIVAAATAAATGLARHRPSGEQITHAGEAALDTGQRAASGTADAVHAAAGTLGNAFTEAARYIFPTSDKAKKSRKGKRRPVEVAGGKADRKRQVQDKRQHH